MQNAVKQDAEMIGAIYNPIHDIAKIGCNIAVHRMLSSAAAGDEDEKALDKGCGLQVLLVLINRKV